MRDTKLIRLGGRLFRELPSPAEKHKDPVPSPDEPPSRRPWRRLVGVLVLSDTTWTAPSETSPS